jgi:2-polyprenyl-6-methoxyphenol hydroxylase-like FAD-dependent oxidoreductase
VAADAWDTVILGGGPVGLITALIAARQGRVLVVLPRRAHARSALRIDSVPVSLLALFIELGVHPAELGVVAVHHHRLVAWDSAAPQVVRGAGTAHIVRPILELRLLERVRSHRAITIVTGARLDALPAACRLLDATGRRAITAEHRYLPANPAILRAIIVRGAFSRAQQAFRLASLPTGYAYRLGTTDTLMLGLVQGREQWRVNAGPLAEKLAAAGIEWLLVGMPRSAHESRIGGVASVQWSSGSGRAVRIGDAAVARDALASQGISNGIAAGLSLFEGLEAGASYCRRTRTEILSHLTTLQQLLRSCAHSAHPFWVNYTDFLSRATLAHPDLVKPGGH